MDSDLFAQFLRDFTEELYHRAAAAKGRDERMAIKGVQHSLERAMEKWGINQFERAVTKANTSSLDYVPITGRGVNELDRRTPAAMQNVREFCGKISAFLQRQRAVD